MLTLCDSKTGVTLKDSGVRDEHGMEPLDSLFSSPEKTNTKGKAVEYEEEDEEDDESSDGGMEMDIDYSMLNPAHDPSSCRHPPKSRKLMFSVPSLSWRSRSDCPS